MKSLVRTEELCSPSVTLEHAPGAKSLVCIGLKKSGAAGRHSLQRLEYRGVREHRDLHRDTQGWKLRALFIQQKFRFKISEIPRAQLNGALRFNRPDPSHRAFGYCSYKQDTKKEILGTTILSNGKGHFGPTNRNDQTSQS